MLTALDFFETRYSLNLSGLQQFTDYHLSACTLEMTRGHQHKHNWIDQFTCLPSVELSPCLAARRCHVQKDYELGFRFDAERGADSWCDRLQLEPERVH